MKTLIKAILSVVIICGSISISAQQVPLYTHYMNNTLVVNPAYAGSRDALTLTALYRAQWIDFNGAPKTQTLSMHSPLRNEHLAMGLSIQNDKIGPTNNTSVFFDYAYILKVTDKSKLALGLSAGLDIYQASLNSLLLDQQVDPTFQNDINGHVTPNFGFGAYYSRERFYAGISVPEILQNNYSTEKNALGEPLIGEVQRHYFFIAGALFNLSDNLAFKPTTLVKVTSSVPIQADFTASFILMQKLLIGAMFRTGDAFGGLVGVDITNQFHLGYSYDWSFGIRTGSYNSGSHELVLRYDVLFNKKQIHSPRNF